VKVANEKSQLQPTQPPPFFSNPTAIEFLEQLHYTSSIVTKRCHKFLLTNLPWALVSLRAMQRVMKLLRACIQHQLVRKPSDNISWDFWSISAAFWHFIRKIRCRPHKECFEANFKHVRTLENLALRSNLTPQWSVCFIKLLIEGAKESINNQARWHLPVMQRTCWWK
jgi:hypothetical protein